LHLRIVSRSSSDRHSSSDQVLSNQCAIRSCCVVVFLVFLARSSAPHRRKNCRRSLPVLFLGTVIDNEIESANCVQFAESGPGAGIEGRQVKFEIRFSESRTRNVCFRGPVLHVSAMGRHPYRIHGQSSGWNLGHATHGRERCLHSLFQSPSRRPSSCSNGQKLGRIVYRDTF
jgi:hypothetical protein